MACITFNNHPSYSTAIQDMTQHHTTTMTKELGAGYIVGATSYNRMLGMLFLSLDDK